MSAQLTQFVLAAAALLLGGGWIWEHWKRRHPTTGERVHTDKETADVVNTYADAHMKGLEFTQSVEKMVDKKVEEKTALFQSMVVRREMECAEQIEKLLKKLSEEVELKNAYWIQFQKAKEEREYWKGMYEELKRKSDKK